MNDMPDKTRNSKSSGSTSRQNKAKSAQASFSKLGKYEIVQKSDGTLCVLGAGGMGSVYLAKDTELGRLVALKVLPKEKAENPRLVKRFKAEARAAAQLEHDNIVRIYESGEDQGYLFIALEYVDGVDVLRLIEKRERLSVKRSTEIVKQIALALQHAYDSNIVHRDIKPSNFLIDKQGVVKLTDMGLARSVDETLETQITRAGTTVGTVDYMSPEQARDSKLADIRSDLYSLGCSWFHMLTGHAPYHTGSMTNKLQAHNSNPIPNPQDENPQVNEVLVAILQRLMAKKPEDRYQTPQELLDDLTGTRLKRAEVSNVGLESLATEAIQASEEEEYAEVGASPFSRSSGSRSSNGNSSGGGSSSGNSSNGGSKPHKLPPKSQRKKLTDADGNEKFEFNPLPFIYAGAGLALIAVVAVIGWAISNLGGGLESGGGNPFANEVIAEEEQGVDGQQPANSDINPMTGEPRTSKNKNGFATEDDDETENTVIVDHDDQGPPNTEDLIFQKWSDRGTQRTVFKSGLDAEPDDAAFEAALNGLPEQQGTIVFADTGPYIFTKPQVIKNAKLVLSALKNTRPLVVFLNPPETGREPGESFQGFQVTNSRLLFDGIHCVAYESEFYDSGPLTFVAARDSAIDVLQSSFSFEGKCPANSSAISMTGTQPAESMLDQMLVRGKGLNAVSGDLAEITLLVSNSMLTSGDASIIEWQSEESQAVPNLSSDDDSPAPRRITVENSWLCSSAPAFEFRHLATKTEPVRTAISMKHCVVQRQASRGPSAMISLLDWPRAQAAKAREDTFRQLGVTVERTSFLGWETLLEAPATQQAPRVEVANADQWQAVWRGGLVDVEVEPSRTSILEANRLGALEPRRLLPQVKQQVSEARWREISELTKLPQAKPNTVERYMAYLQQPGIPLELTDWEDARVFELNLDKKDLGDYLKNPELPEKFVVKLSGSGLRISSPIHLNGKQVRLEFPERKSGTLRLKPETINRATLPRSKEKYEAFINLNGGQLELVNAVIDVPASKRDAVVKWLLLANHADVLLKNCYFSCPMQETDRHEGVIRWNTKPTAAGDQTRHQLAIESSFLETAGTVCDLALTNGDVFLDDSLLVGLKVGVVVNDASTPDASSVLGPDATINLNHCTLSAGNRLLTFHSDAAGQRTHAPLRVFANATVFGPQLLPEQGTQIVSVDPTFIRSGRLEWWGNYNGFADAIPWLAKWPAGEGLMQSSDDPVNQWQTLWGDDHARNPLFGANGVYLKQQPADLLKLKPDQFELDPTSRAAQWELQKETIGADVVSLVLGDVKKSEKNESNTGGSRTRKPTSGF